MAWTSTVQLLPLNSAATRFLSGTSVSINKEPKEDQIDTFIFQLGALEEGFWGGSVGQGDLAQNLHFPSME
eukprot:1159902-Pelagomonas_calceolata.AAC.5